MVEVELVVDDDVEVCPSSVEVVESASVVTVPGRELVESPGCDVEPASAVVVEGSTPLVSGANRVNIARLTTVRMAATIAPVANGEGLRAGMTGVYAAELHSQRNPYFRRPILGRVTRPAPPLAPRPGLIRGIWGRIVDADLSINAAAVAYNAFLALVPLGAALLGIASFFGRSESTLTSIRESLGVVAPETVVTFVTDLLVEVADFVGDSGVWLITASVLLSAFLGSRAVVALQKALGAVENRTEARRGLQLRMVAIGLTLLAGVALIVTSLLLVAGRRTIAFLAEWAGAGWLETVWTWLRVPVGLAGLYGFLIAFYRWGPPEPLPRAWLAALVGSGGTLLASLGFGLYLSVSPELGVTFGVLGAMAIALVWLYVGAMAILLGAVVVAYVLRWRSDDPDPGAPTITQEIPRFTP